MLVQQKAENWDEELAGSRVAQTAALLVGKLASKKAVMKVGLWVEPTAFYLAEPSVGSRAGEKA